MPKSLGFGIGIFLKENTLNIVENSDKIVEAGNMFLIDLTFTAIKYEAKKGAQKTFGVQLIDTVLVEEKGQEVLTASVSKVLADISYSLDDDEEDQKRKPKPDLPERTFYFNIRIQYYRRFSQKKKK